MFDGIVTEMSHIRLCCHLCWQKITNLLLYPVVASLKKALN